MTTTEFDRFTIFGPDRPGRREKDPAWILAFTEDLPGDGTVPVRAWAGYGPTEADVLQLARSFS